MEPTTRDQATTVPLAAPRTSNADTTPDASTWLITLAGLVCVAFGIPAIASIPDLGVALLIASILAATIITATNVIARVTR